MNDATAALLFDVVTRLEHSIQARDCPAMVALDGSQKLILSDYDYLRDDPTAIAFEQRAAVKAREINAHRWVLAVPQIWKITRTEVYARPVSNRPLNPGEEEAITWTACDPLDGVDYGRVPYTRRPNGQPVFDEPEIFTVPIQAAATTTPGFTLLRSLTEDP